MQDVLYGMGEERILQYKSAFAKFDKVIDYTVPFFCHYKGLNRVDIHFHFNGHFPESSPGK